jgi:rhamnosyltransferase
MASVDILLATYNGAAHVREQIASLQQQTFSDWRLLIRDDGSSDATPTLLAELAQSDSRIEIVADTLGNLGFNGNFHALLRASQAPWVMFCDQDDVWLPSKIERTLCVMRDQPVDEPVVVHCDAVVSDAHLRPLLPRFIGDRGLARGLPSVLLANPVQGAAMMINASLRALMVQNIPSLPFDYQAALLAEATGRRVFIPEALLLYRQHGGNVIGAGTAPASSGVQNQNRSASTWRRAGMTLTIGLLAAPHVETVLRPVQARWRANTAEILAHHARFVRVGFSWAKLAWWWRSDYQYFRRRDRYNALLWALGWYRSLTV